MVKDASKYLQILFDRNVEAVLHIHEGRLVIPKKIREEVFFVEKKSDGNSTKTETKSEDKNVDLSSDNSDDLPF